MVWRHGRLSHEEPTSPTVWTPRLRATRYAGIRTYHRRHAAAVICAARVYRYYANRWFADVELAHAARCAFSCFVSRRTPSVYALPRVYSTGALRRFRDVAAVAYSPMLARYGAAMRLFVCANSSVC